MCVSKFCDDQFKYDVVFLDVVYGALFARSVDKSKLWTWKAHYLRISLHCMASTITNKPYSFTAAGRDIATANWCWIKESCDNTTTITTPRCESVLWMLLAGKLWEITSYILIIIVYARIYVYVREQRKLVSVLLFLYIHCIYDACCLVAMF